MVLASCCFPPRSLLQRRIRVAFVLLPLGRSFIVSCHYVLHLVQPFVPALLEPIQLAQSAGGCERAIHILQAALEYKSDDSVVLSVDFSNAFNTLRRDVMLSRTFWSSSCPLFGA